MTRKSALRPVVPAAAKIGAEPPLTDAATHTNGSSTKVATVAKSWSGGHLDGVNGPRGTQVSSVEDGSCQH